MQLSERIADRPTERRARVLLLPPSMRRVVPDDSESTNNYFSSCLHLNRMFVSSRKLSAKVLRFFNHFSLLGLAQCASLGGPVLQIASVRMAMALSREKAPGKWEHFSRSLAPRAGRSRVAFYFDSHRWESVPFDFYVLLSTGSGSLMPTREETIRLERSQRNMKEV